MGERERREGEKKELSAGKRERETDRQAERVYVGKVGGRDLKRGDQ